MLLQGTRSEGCEYPLEKWKHCEMELFAFLDLKIATLARNDLQRTVLEIGR